MSKSTSKANFKNLTGADKAFVEGIFAGLNKALFPKEKTTPVTKKVTPTSNDTYSDGSYTYLDGNNRSRSAAAKKAWKTIRANTPKATLTKRFRAAGKKAAATRARNAR